MLQIDDVVVSFDVLREKFLCNLDACKGECCIEGDAGAPVEFEEVEKLEEVLYPSFRITGNTSNRMTDRK